VRNADVQHLARADKIVERAHDFLNRRQLVPRVHPVKVNVIRAEPLERTVQRLRHVLAMVAARVEIAAPLVEGKLGGDDKLVAVAANELADKFFTRAGSIAISGVQKIAAGIDVSVEDGLGLALVRAPAPF